MADNVFFRLARRGAAQRAAQNAYQREYRRARLFGLTVAAYRQRYRVSLACCGQWWPVETLPHVCPGCGQRYFEPEE